MQTLLKSLPALLDHFKDEALCRAYMEQRRWNGKIVCPHCNAPKAYRTNRGYKCSSRTCYKKFTVTTGTVMENTKISLRTWIAAIYILTSHKKGISSLQLHRDLHITQRTAWFLLHRVREMFAEKYPALLCGTLEADETYHGGKNKNRHKDKKVKGSQGRASKDKTPVVGLLERNGKVKAFVVAETERAALHNINQHVAAKDGHGGHRRLPFLRGFIPVLQTRYGEARGRKLLRGGRSIPHQQHRGVLERF